MPVARPPFKAVMRGVSPESIAILSGSKYDTHRCMIRLRFDTRGSDLSPPIWRRNPDGNAVYSQLGLAE